MCRAGTVLFTLQDTLYQVIYPQRTGKTNNLEFFESKKTIAPK
jgi:hypothetical protein